MSQATEYTQATGAQAGQGRAQRGRLASTQLGWASEAKCTYSSSKWGTKQTHRVHFGLFTRQNSTRNTRGTMSRRHTQSTLPAGLLSVLLTGQQLHPLGSPLGVSRLFLVPDASLFLSRLSSPPLTYTYTDTAPNTSVRNNMYIFSNKYV